MADDGTAGGEPRNLTAQTLGGIRWTYPATIATAAMQIAYVAVMGRLLTPAAFGLVAMAMVALRFGQHFARMGLGQALVQKRTITDEEVRAGFTSSVLLGAAFTAAFVVGAPAAIHLFDEPGVVPVLQLISLSLLAQGLGMTSQALLRRGLRFRALAVLEVVSYVIGYFAVGVPLALAGAGVYSLVGAVLTQTGVLAALQYAAERHSVRPTLHWPSYRRLYGFGSRASVVGFLEFLTTSLDTLVIGRYAGAGALGQYNRAFALVNLPLEQFTTSLSKVLFPSMSRVQDDTRRLRGVYLSTVGVLAAVLLPVAVGMAVAAPEIVGVVLGPQWGPAARVLPILAVVATISFLTHVAGTTCMAVAALNEKLLVQSLSLLVTATLLLLAVGQSLEVYATAVLGAVVVRHLLYTAVLRRLLSLDLGAVLRRYGAAAVAAGPVAASVWLVQALVTPVLPALVLGLALEIAAGAFGLAVGVRLPPLRGIRRDLLQRLEHAGVRRDSKHILGLALRLALGRDAAASHF